MFKDDKTTHSAFESFCRHTEVILPREDYSLRELQDLSGLTDLPNCFNGLDSAFLYKPKLTHTTSKHPYFAYCFQRSGISFYDTQRINLEHTLNLPGRYIPWTEPGLFRTRSLKKALNIINGAELIITDIYHVCVNALNIGKPVICFTRSTASMNNTLSDRKKLALFEAVNGRDWLLKLGENETLSDHIEPIIQLANIARTENKGIKKVLEQIEIRRQCMLNTLQNFFGIS